MAKTPKIIRLGRARIRRALRAIDPTWTGKMLRDQNPLPLPEGVDPVSLVLRNRYGGIGREMFPCRDIGREILPPYTDPEDQTHDS